MLLTKTKIFIGAAAVFLFSISFSSQAESLLEVYQHALKNDTQFKQAQANWYAAQENLPIAKAALFPALNLQANVGYNNQNYTQDAAFAGNGDYASSFLNLNLTQPVLNYGLWKNVERAEASVKSATAAFYSAQQDLITRTVKAYLNVLQAHDALKYVRASKTAFAEEYDNVKQKYDVGLAPISDVYDAQAKYDQASAQEIADINALENSLETLHEITGHYYPILDGLSEKGIPLTTPTPNNIDLWAKKAAAQNYQLKAQHFNVESAQAHIGVQAAQHLPSFELQGNFSDQRQFDRTLLITNQNKNLVYQLGTVAVGVNWDLFSGGSVVAETRQARHQYAAACAQEEMVYRQVISATRQAFLGVNSYSAQIRADALSIKSSAQALKSAKAGYEIGTRTLFDVLEDITQLYQNEQTHASDQYAYIKNFVTLKESAGTLSAADVVKLTSWLKNPIDLESAKKPSKVSNIKQARKL